MAGITNSSGVLRFGPYHTHQRSVLRSTHVQRQLTDSAPPLLAAADDSRRCPQPRRKNAAADRHIDQNTGK
jgi:hypothetical protein